MFSETLCTCIFGARVIEKVRYAYKGPRMCMFGFDFQKWGASKDYVLLFCVFEHWFFNTTISFVLAHIINFIGRRKMMNIRQKISAIYIRCADGFLSYRDFLQNKIHGTCTWLKSMHMSLPCSYFHSIVLQKPPIKIVVSKPISYILIKKYLHHSLLFLCI